MKVAAPRSRSEWPDTVGGDDTVWTDDRARSQARRPLRRQRDSLWTASDRGRLRLSTAVQPGVSRFIAVLAVADVTSPLSTEGHRETGRALTDGRGTTRLPLERSRGL